MAAIDTSGFQPRTLDKVERLLDLVDEMQRHPDLKGSESKSMSPWAWIPPGISTNPDYYTCII